MFGGRWWQEGTEGGGALRLISGPPPPQGLPGDPCPPGPPPPTLSGHTGHSSTEGIPPIPQILFREGKESAQGSHSKSGQPAARNRTAEC